MPSTTSFPLFSLLPTELRDKIWIHTVDWQPHVLPRPPITELAVCHEARRVLLHIYKPCFRPGSPYRRDDTEFSIGSSPGERWLQIHGMGNRSPRSPYANYETDGLYLNWAIWSGVQRGEPLQKFLHQEAIDHIQHVTVLINAWEPRRHGGPIRRVGDPPRPPIPDGRLVLTSFGSLKTLSLVDEPKLRVSIAPLNEEQLRQQREFHALRYDDEVLKWEKLALKSKFVDGKMLVLVVNPDDSCHAHFELKSVKEWVDQKAKELPGWKAPEVLYRMIVAET